MKILQGTLVETLYDWPDSEAIMSPHSTSRESTMTPRKTTVLDKNDVAYMSDKVRSLTTRKCGFHPMFSSYSSPPLTGRLWITHVFRPLTPARHICFSAVRRTMFNERQICTDRPSSRIESRPRSGGSIVASLHTALRSEMCVLPFTPFSKVLWELGDCLKWIIALYPYVLT